MIIKNSQLAGGLYKALSDLVNTSFPEGMGDICWELAVLAADIEKQVNAYDKIAAKIKKDFDEVRNKLIEKYVPSEEDKKDKEKLLAFQNDQELKDATDKFQKSLDELQAQETKYDRPKVVINKADLKKLGLKPVTLVLLMEILDVR